MFTCRLRQIVTLVNGLTKQRTTIRLINGISYKMTKPIEFLNPVSALNSNLQICRCRHKDTRKGQKPDVSESESEDESSEWDNEIVDKQTKLITVRVNSLRADLVLKAGLGIARNKIETMFYENKIRVNGLKLEKKATMLSVGDEVDIVRGTSTANPAFLTVSRVEILSAGERGEGLTVKLRRNKALTIENYLQDPHKS